MILDKMKSLLLFQQTPTKKKKKPAVDGDANPSKKGITVLSEKTLFLGQKVRIAKFYRRNLMLPVADFYKFETSHCLLSEDHTIGNISGRTCLQITE